MLDQMVLRMRSAGMYKAGATWHDNAKELQGQRTLLGEIALRMKNAVLYTESMGLVSLKYENGQCVGCRR